MLNMVQLVFKGFCRKSFLNERKSCVSCLHKKREGLRLLLREESLRCPYCIYKFYKSCLDDKLITLSLTAAHSMGSKGAGLRGDGP